MYVNKGNRKNTSYRNSTLLKNEPKYRRNMLLFKT